MFFFANILRKNVTADILYNLKVAYVNIFWTQFLCQNNLFGAFDARMYMNTTDPHKLLQNTGASIIKHSLYSTMWIYWAVFKQKYDVIVISAQRAHIHGSFAHQITDTTRT